MDSYTGSFSQKSVANSFLYHKRLTSLEHGTHPILEYLQEAKYIVDALVATGESLSNKDLVNVVLRGRGFEFDMLVTTIESFDTLPMVSTLHSRLLNFETRHKTAAQSTPTAFLATQILTNSLSNFGSQNNFRNKRKKNNGRNNPPHTDNTDILSSVPTTTSPCQLCFTFRHGARSCPRLSTFTPPPMPRSLHSAFAGLQIAPAPASQGYHSSFSTQPPYEHAWYPDTGASTHMTGNTSLIQLRVSYTDPDSVLLSNGDQLPIAYTGNMALPIGSFSFDLNNVYVIPSMRKNLLSIAQFYQDNHVLCAFDSNHFYICDLVNGFVLYSGPCKNSLYKLPTIPHRLQALSASLQSSSLWHNRLGHPSSKVMSFLGSNKLLSSEFRFKKSFC